MTAEGGAGALRPGLASVSGRALGTSLHVVVTRAERVDAADRAVDQVVADIDRTCSRFSR